MDAVFRRQLRQGQLTLQRLQRHLALKSAVYRFRFPVIKSVFISRTTQLTVEFPYHNVRFSFAPLAFSSSDNLGRLVAAQPPTMRLPHSRREIVILRGNDQVAVRFEDAQKGEW